MGASLASVTPDFLQRIERIIERTEHRRALSAEDRELIERTRRLASSRRHSAWVIGEGDLIDEEDGASSLQYDIMTYLDRKFAGTFRLHVGPGYDLDLPSRLAFGDVLADRLQGRVVVDLTRIAANQHYACKYPELSYLTVRVAWLAAAHFGADLITTTCLDGQRSVYERAFGFETLGAPVRAPQYGRSIVCMAVDCRANKSRIEQRFPMFRSTDAERCSLFGPFATGFDTERDNPARRGKREAISTPEARL